DPTYQAANYPETVTLADMIASPQWRSCAISDEPADRDRFHTEFAARLARTFPGEPPNLRNLRTLVQHTASLHRWPSAPTFENTPPPPPASPPAPTTGPAPAIGALTG